MKVSETRGETNLLELFKIEFAEQHLEERSRCLPCACVSIDLGDKTGVSTHAKQGKGQER